MLVPWKAFFYLLWSLDYMPLLCSFMAPYTYSCSTLTALYYNCLFTNLYLLSDGQFFERKYEYYVHYHIPKTDCSSWNRVSALKSIWWMNKEWIVSGNSKVGWQYEEKANRRKFSLSWQMLVSSYFHTFVLTISSTWNDMFCLSPRHTPLYTHTPLRLASLLNTHIDFFSKLFWNLLPKKYILTCDYFLSYNFSNCFIWKNFVCTLR